MPRFRQLSADEIDQKSGPHDLVTDADRLAEKYLTAALTALLPGSVVVGEEAVHADPTTYEAIRGTAPVWIVDLVDGTRQFVHGDLVLHAGRARPGRRGARVDVRARPGRVRHRDPRPGGRARRRTAALRFARARPRSRRRDLPPGLHHGRAEAGAPRPARRGVVPRHCGSAGLEYLAIARGELDATAFSWEAAWDHAAGLLLVEEAGGAHLTLRGEPFRVTGGNALPFTAARDEATARRVVSLLAARSEKVTAGA